MATIRAFTTIEQSRKLAEILPLESADMFYPTNSDWEGKIIGLLDVPLYIGSDGFVDTEMGEIYAWSLAALLGVLPEYNLQSTNWGNGKVEHKIVVYIHENRYASNNYYNPIDACVDMIEKLHELNLL